jgi:tetratricopeptide (TPR) repeat protein
VAERADGSDGVSSVVKGRAKAAARHREGWLGGVSLLGFVVFAVYANSLHTGFALDAVFLVLQDPRVREPSAENLERILGRDYWWPKGTSGLYRPVTTLSYLLQYAILGERDRPFGYHLFNVLLHWTNAVLFWRLAQRVLASRGRALFASALFAVHPANTEAVTNVVGRADLLATSALLCSLLLHARAGEASGAGWAVRIAALAPVSLVGAFAKETGFVLPALLGLYDLCVSRPVLRRLLPSYGVALGTLASAALWRMRVFSRLPKAEIPFLDNPLVAADFWTARLTALSVIGQYARLLVWPRTLCCDYSYDRIRAFSWDLSSAEDVRALLSTAGLAAFVAAIARARRRRPAAAFFGGVLLVGLLPVANLFVLVGTIMAERFLYLPSIGFAGLVAGVFSDLLEGLARRCPAGSRLAVRVLGGAAAVLLLSAAATRTVLRNPEWRDDLSLWGAAVRDCPGSAKAHLALATALFQSDPERRSIDRVLAEAEKAVSIAGDRVAAAWANLGAYLSIKGDTLAQRLPSGELLPTPQSQGWYRRAAEALRKARQIDAAGGSPKTAEIYWSLGVTRLRLSEPLAALEAFETYRRLLPSSPGGYSAIASAALAAGRIDKAVLALHQLRWLGGPAERVEADLVALYRRAGFEECIGRSAAGAEVLREQCEADRTWRCEAWAELGRLASGSEDEIFLERLKAVRFDPGRCAAPRDPSRRPPR